MTKRVKRKLTLVLMAGLPGTGKTTLAAELGRKLRWPVLDKDMLKLQLLKLEIEHDLAGRATYDQVFALAEDLLVRQRLSLIIDTSAHHPFILEHAIRIAHEANARLKIVLCTAASAVRMEREDQRDSSPLAHHHLELAQIEDDLRLFTHFPPDVLTLCTSNPFDEYLTEAMRYLNK